MCLRPLLGSKVDELFLLWLSEPDTQSLLRLNLTQVLRGEPVTRPASQLAALNRPGNGSSGRQPKSPRVRPSSPSSAPPYSSIPSPRRQGSQSLTGKSRPLPGNVQPTPVKEITVSQPITVLPSVDRKENIAARGEPEGEHVSFLRKKEAELRQRREREKQTTDQPQEPAAVQIRPRRPELPPETAAAQPTPIPTPAAVPAPPLPVVDAAAAEKVQPTSPVRDVAGPGISDSSLQINNNASVRTSAAVTAPSVPAAGGKPAGGRVISAVTSQPVVPTTVLTTVVKPSSPTRPTSAITAGSSAASNIPAFYFPTGVPSGASAADVGDERLQKLTDEFEKAEGGKVMKAQFGPVVKALGLPLYWKCPVFNFAGGEKTGYVTLQSVLAAWKKLVSNCFDETSRFLKLVAKPGRQFLEFDDFLPLIQDVVDTHPGLTFLQDAPEFHSRYVQTVISRIFYTINRSWSGRITLPEIKKSNFLQTVRRLEEEDDINQITDYFSYEHFYVIYCKFWELDKDHDLLISKEDLSRHNDHAISSRIIDRIFSGAVTRNLVDGKLCYKDFVWFLISEEDKRNHRSIEYWFRCMDLDGDGIISMYEMEYFYEEQVEKMEMLGIETLPFQDCLCQMLDMVRPGEEGRIRLKDLKACSLTPIFFDTFINLDKYLEHEQKDPFASIRDQDGDEPEPTDWERYAADEYELLVAEEGAADMQQEDVMYEDDFEPDRETGGGTDSPAGTMSQTGKKASTTPSNTPGGKSTAPSNTVPGRTPSTKKDDIYEFGSTDVSY